MQKNDRSIDLKLFGQTLLPSTSSAIFSVIAGVILSLGVIFLTRYKSSSISKGYLAYQSGHHLTLGFLNKSIFATGILGNSLIFAFWLVAGILVYVLAVDIIKGLKSTIETEQELTYVHLNRSAFLKYTLTRLFIRLITIIVWAVYIYEFIHKILPFAIYLSIVASGSGSITHMPVYVISGIAIVALAVHIHLILLRLVLLRPRVFNNQII